MVEDEFAVRAGRVLRRARASKGLTLREVGARSSGALKATAVAGYERGERAISLKRFFQLSTIYAIEPERLMAEIARITQGRPPVVVDLAALESIDDQTAQTVAEFARQVRRLRGEQGGTLTLRAGDLSVIATLAGSQPERLLERIEPALARKGPPAEAGPS